MTMHDLMYYLGAKSVPDLWMLLANGIASVWIALRLVFADISKGAKLSRSSQMARGAFVVVYGVLAFRIWHGWYYTPVDPSELGVNLLMAAVAWSCRGDLRVFGDALKRARDGK